uniref:Uncharacterized protein n=1 Tax=Caenorhabditis japonica TaxID=281687 RepID=A0A8R1HNT6_CAEJA
MTRYSNFPAVSIVNCEFSLFGAHKYLSMVIVNANDELQLALPRIPKRANTIAAFSGYSSDSALSVATDTPLDWEHNWHFTDKLKEHRMCNTGDMTRGASRLAADRYMIERKLKELIRRKHLLLKEDRRFELQDTVPIFEKLEKMHPPLIYCRLKGMELRKLRRSVDPSLREDMDKSKNARTATSYLFRKRIEFLEKTLPCRNDPRILLTHGWKVFAKRENPENFKNVAKILRQRSAWVSKNCLSRSATVPRCDKLPQNEGVKYKKYFLVLLFLLTCFLVMATMSMMSYL